MKTRDFIEKYAQIIRDSEYHKDAHCSSVFYSDGRLYSYGRHYPLLYPITKPDGKILLVLNRSGYSVTTSKHIGWCWRVFDVAVHQTGIYPTFDGVKEQLEKELVEAVQKHANLKRKNTQKAAMLLTDIETIKGYLVKLNDADCSYGTNDTNYCETHKVQH